jgi:hypothetical protein
VQSNVAHAEILSPNLTPFSYFNAVSFLFARMMTSRMALAVAQACGCLLALATAKEVEVEPAYKHKKHHDRYEKDSYHGSEDKDSYHGDHHSYSTTTKTITLYACDAVWCPAGVVTAPGPNQVCGNTVSVT